MKKKKCSIGTICLIVVLVFLVSEGMLREIWGFANMPLFYASREYEYMTCPSQEGVRFGKRFFFNTFGQRSQEPDSSRTVILGLGDSVINGGVLTDQDSLATTIFSKETGSQMLNISAGSWGPDNCAAYLKKMGLFNAKALFLVVSSHDAYDCMDFSPVVGVHPSYPDSQYLLAWSELVCRYIWPRLFGKKNASSDPDQKVLNGEIKKNGKEFNPGFEQLKEIADSANIPLYVCLHPEITEIRKGTYNDQGLTIISWCKKHGIQPILELNEGIKRDMYRDKIHPNERGQKFLSQLMKKHIKLEQKY